MNTIDSQINIFLIEGRNLSKVSDVFFGDLKGILLGEIHKMT